mmetsp:Transcript_46118/g.142065  ORF Transcript_46118/g.142065 Transcript_46118/m.142065 type:complete len:245 (-) Transcript_46118:34-768(-)
MCGNTWSTDRCDTATTRPRKTNARKHSEAWCSTKRVKRNATASAGGTASCFAKSRCRREEQRSTAKTSRTSTARKVPFIVAHLASSSVPKTPPTVTPQSSSHSRDCGSCSSLTAPSTEATTPENDGKGGRGATGSSSSSPDSPSPSAASRGGRDMSFGSVMILRPSSPSSRSTFTGPRKATWSGIRVSSDNRYAAKADASFEPADSSDSEVRTAKLRNRVGNRLRAGNSGSQVRASLQRVGVLI